jgi:streptogramin lyase
MPRLLRTLALVSLFSLVAGSAFAALPPAQRLLLTGQSASGLYAAFVDPATATVHTFSTGGLIVSPWTIAQGHDGFVYVGNSSNIIRINPCDGSQSVFSTNPSPGMVSVSNMIVHSNGDIYYTNGRVMRVDINTGVQTVLAPVSSGATCITEGPDHQLYVSCLLGTSPNAIVVERVDPVTGAVTPMAYGGVGKPRSLAFDNRDSLYLESTNDRGVFRVDLVAGTVGYLTTSDISYTSFQMVGYPDGYLYFTHLSAGTPTPRIDRQDPVTGAKSILVQGAPLGLSVVGLGVTPFTETYCATPTSTSSWGALKSVYR